MAVSRFLRLLLVAVLSIALMGCGDEPVAPRRAASRTCASILANVSGSGESTGPRSR